LNSQFQFGRAGSDQSAISNSRFNLSTMMDRAELHCSRSDFPNLHRRTRINLCTAGGQYHSGGPDYGYPLGSARPDHGPGHRKRLRRPTGRFLLVPQGARLIGIYDSQVAFGQSRVLLVWTRLIMLNGRSIILERQPGADTAGYTGLEDEIDNHWGALFKAALLSTLLGVGSELGSTTGTGSNSDVITALRRGSSDSLNQTGQKVVRQNLNIQPTLTVRPGFPVRVIVNRDLVLEPYKG
jgi:hypothetical protein